MAATETVPAPAGRARWTRLIPVAIIVYIISFMDRTNIGFAFDGMGKDLHLDSAAKGLAGGIFFIGYLVMQIPGGHLAERWSAKKFVGIMILIWGVFAFAAGLVQNYTQLLIVRFLLGVAEGGIWPAILVLISHWFPARERARAYGFWMMNIAISSIITAPLSGWILTWGDWRTLFFIEGAFPFVIAAPIWWWLVADRPSQASWVSRDEREYIETSLARENAEAPRFAGYREVFRSSVVWRLVLVYFFIQVGFYGLNLWLPHLVKDTIGGSYLVVGAITAIPYVFAIVGLWMNARSADRTGRYSVHVHGIAGHRGGGAGAVGGLRLDRRAVGLPGQHRDGGRPGLRRPVLGQRLAGCAGGAGRRGDGPDQRPGQPRRLRRSHCRRIPAGRQRRQFHVDGGGARGRAGARRPGHDDPAQAGRQADRRTARGRARCAPGAVQDRVPARPMTPDPDFGSGWVVDVS